MQENGHKRQVGALPWRWASAGELEVLLVTSRETRRWIIPKGNAEHMPPHLDAAREAAEEAGVMGEANPASIGSYIYLKTRADRDDEWLVVDVYALAVTHEAAQWPEMDERQRRWFSQSDAADQLFEDDLAALIRSFTP